MRISILPITGMLIAVAVPSWAHAQDDVCYGDAQPQTATMLVKLKSVTLPYTYHPTQPTDLKEKISEGFTNRFRAPLRQIGAVYELQRQNKRGMQNYTTYVQSLPESENICGYYLFPLAKFALPKGKTAIVMRAMPEYAEAAEQTWAAVLCPDGRVQSVKNIEPGSERSDIANYTYTVKAVINADLTVDYWRNRMKGATEAGEKGKPYDQGQLNLLK